MRFRRKLGPVRLITWLALGALLGSSFVRNGYSWWAGVLAAILFVLVSLPSWLFWYWDILPDRLIQRRYFGRTTFLFPDITYCGPVTGNLAGRLQTRDWIEIRTSSGKWMVAQPDDRAAFLNEMRKHLPKVTLNSLVGETGH